ncbi:MAG: hypothetical protein ACD_31C00005G0074 [uncultured bacterium]|uniref:Uncharacterized protein n=3 Tax=Candidatus Daviesiibacteriota TaxID=1752718 RepID=A0A0G0EY22_9BACT|nr:MAG: hypothetical protein ACD_31C00005G0074 [uncultured bacterium]KKQ10367.1 MAG: hypothetical protein US19_C0006G0009 [Candidatus Daviesbacteria bacterium GW2011_GWB1_36_5]KKQ15514.1 MAG: hypothetical protein US28_C0015G0015 [Candidatus Daviesbacteria bacterium GW2011_GWA1_36_8]OGE17805.1 MAG: hypothetical protein A2858_03610 [Candidatus Daviesbacteria bacterium RIFCSPHIGHO2_01_FULL_36_37]
MLTKISLDKGSLIILLLLIGFIFRLVMTSNGNFIFNIDNARDYVDVREMVVAGKLRLTGPTSAIDGFYNGPFWYYLLAVPFVLADGNPYGGVVMMIVLWAIGGFFLLKLVSRWGSIAIITAGLVWAFSNYMTLASVYSFNPHPVTFLTPLFIYLLEKYLVEKKGRYLIGTFVLAGLFFNFEMNFGVFTPVIIILSLLIYRKFTFLKRAEFWVGIVVFLLFLTPQVLFDLKHEFIMSKSIIKYLSANDGGAYNLAARFKLISDNFINTFIPTYFNQKNFVQLSLLIFFLILITQIRKKKIFDNKLVLISLIFILIPYIGYIFIPVTVNSWHLGAVCTATIILLGFIIGELNNLKKFGTLTALSILVAVGYFSYLNLIDFVSNFSKPNNDPSSFKNELVAIDYIYQSSGGKNFKVYTYLPSVIDYPYQYLIWWRGTRKYGYLPEDYAYLPNKPKYIGSKEKFENTKDIESSELVFLVKEPDRIKQRHLWENNFRDLTTVKKEMVGPIEIEIKSY